MLFNFSEMSVLNLTTSSCDQDTSCDNCDYYGPYCDDCYSDTCDTRTED